MSALRASQSTFQRFINSEASGGLVLIACAALGLLVANSPLSESYAALLHAKLAGLDVLHWINDGLMASFFLLVGLEIKREMLEGQLDSWGARAAPLIAALGGMVAPALLFYVAINAGTSGELARLGDPDRHRYRVRARRAIAARLARARIAESLPHLACHHRRSRCHTHHRDLLCRANLRPGSRSCRGHRRCTFRPQPIRREPLAPYLLLGSMLWACMLFSGIHATLSGVVLAMAIPLSVGKDHAGSPLHRLERALSPWVAFLVVPIFGFANAGVTLDASALGSLLTPLGLGVAGGLFLGKQAGIMAAVFLAERFGVAPLPQGANWREIYGVAVLCGIGFTMSLFISLLAFADAEPQATTKLAVLVGSLLSALAGAVILLAGTSKRGG